MQRTVVAALVLMVWTRSCPALVSTNVPLDHWSYDAVDKLANYGFIDSAMLTMKPISRVEMARHVGQAMHRLNHEKDPPGILTVILERLQREYAGELILIGVLDGWYGDTFIKPIEDPYTKYLYARNEPDIENARGDVFRRGSNFRVGFAARAKLFERFAFYLHPEYVDSAGEDADVDLIEGYGKVMVGPFEIEAGKDSLWWGPGYHGSILMSNNATPFTMIKITNPQPMELPWLFRGLGPFRAQWFLAQLEEDRYIPEARLSGIRLNVKPHPLLEFGASRVIQFGGRGVPRVDLFDYAKLFLTGSNQERDNQLAGVDASLLIPLTELPFAAGWPLRSIKLYLDGAGEDEAGGVPSNWGFLYGVQLNDIFKTGRTDLRIEYADNHVAGKPNVFYNHSVYRSGYTYEDRVIGHHMGTDSRNLFVQLSHYLTDDMLVDLSYSRRTHNLSGDVRPMTNVFECNVMLFPSSDWRIGAGYRYEDADRGQDDNHIFQIQLIREW